MQLHDEMKEWNSKINLISRKDEENIFERHILHSLAIAKHMDFKPGARIMDLGTGGGFPGLPLAILFPFADFLLVDSMAKKINVLREITMSMQMINVQVICERAEKINESFDFIVTRATAPMPDLVKWVGRKVKTGKGNTSSGILALKGGDMEAELKGIKGRAKVFPLNKWFKEEFFDTKVLVHWKP